MQPIICADKVSFSYGSFPALSEVSFSVSAGQVFALIGPNGAGKTTLLRVLTGQHHLASGQVSVLGLDPGSQADRLHAQIGVMPENAGHYERLSVLDNLRFFASIYRTPNANQRIVNLLEQVGLSDKAKAKVSALSKGMKQRLALARALVGSPKLLFLDEPTAGLDPWSARSVRQLIHGFCEQGGTVFLTTHYMEEAEVLCQNVAFLNKGRLLCSGGPFELCKKYLPAQVPVLRAGKNILAEPGLEDLFYHLTGKSINDGENSLPQGVV